MTTIEAQAKLDALIAEQSDVRQKITATEAELKRLNDRLTQLGHGWHRNGEILDAKLAVRDSAFPILKPGKEGDCWNLNVRIIAVSKKTITTREDGRQDDDVQRYSIATGAPPNSKYHAGIDVAKALKIWADHCAASPA